MLPPPSTIATSTPESWTSLSCSAMLRTVSGSVPYSSGPMSASPESFTRTRLNAGARLTPPSGSGRSAGSPGVTPTPSGARRSRAHLEAGEAPDDDVLPSRAGQLLAELLDGLAAVAVGVDVRLIEQHDVVHPGLQLALGDAAADVLGLVRRLLLEDPELGLPGLLGDVLLGHVAGERRGGDVQRDLAGEGHEVLVAGHEVRVAV